MIGDARLPEMDDLRLHQRLLAAGYTPAQVDAVFGITRQTSRSCETCRHSHIYRNDPWCLTCSDNSRRTDDQKSRWEACHD